MQPDLSLTYGLGFVQGSRRLPVVYASLIFFWVYCLTPRQCYLVLFELDFECHFS